MEGKEKKRKERRAHGRPCAWPCAWPCASIFIYIGVGVMKARQFVIFTMENSRKIEKKEEGAVGHEGWPNSPYGI